MSSIKQQSDNYKDLKFINNVYKIIGDSTNFLIKHIPVYKPNQEYDGSMIHILLEALGGNKFKEYGKLDYYRLKEADEQIWINLNKLYQK